jgi:hypothetical protein
MFVADIVKPFLTSLSTIVPATVIFVLGQILTRFVLEPIQDQARTVGRIAFSLLAYADYTPDSQSSEKLEEASNNLRELAAQLRASRRVIPCYYVLSLLRCVISKRILLESSADLILWSNAIFTGDTRHYREHLARLLKVPGLDLVTPSTTVPAAERPTSAATDDLTDDEDETPEIPPFRHRNICAILAQDAPRSLAA